MSATAEQVRPDTAEAAAWAERAEELAAWAWRLVNRTDVWGGYLPLSRREKDKDGKPTNPARTKPAVKQRGRLVLTLDTLGRHFRADAPEHVVGLHTTAPDHTSRWGATEIDLHNDGTGDPEANWRAAVAWYGEQRQLGFRPLLTDSNGKGGYHLRFFLDAPAPTPDVFAFLNWQTNDYGRHGLPKRPETFPKQPDVRGGKGCGNWLRLPGRHHTREHWSRVWDGGRWLSGAEAVAHVLALRPSRPEVIYGHRAESYLAKLPNHAEGDGRDNVAFNLACFLVRDLGLSDAYAMGFLERWDGLNTPPLGRDVLAQKVANAHDYGRRPYGGARAASASAASGAGDHDGKTTTPAGWEIIRDYFRQRYGDGFRVGELVFSPTEERDVKRQEACAVMPPDLMNALAKAVNAPKYGPDADVEKLPGFFKKWVGTGWGAYFAALPDEDHAPAGVAALARDEFRRLVRQAMFSEFTLDRTVRDPVTKEKETRREHRSVIGWCNLFAKPGRWETVRDKQVWCKLDLREHGVAVLRVALRHELFSQLKADRRLIEMKATRFMKRATRYDVGAAGGQEDRPGGRWVLVLADDFVDDLTASIPDEQESHSDDPAF